jgi:carboxypeptidase Q
MVDSGYLYENNKVPMMKNLIKDTPDESYYFTFHHSAGDTVSILDSNDLDSNVAAIAAMFYIIADSDTRLPREYKAK